MWKILIAVALAPALAAQAAPGAVTLHGRVVDLQGKPIAGVAVADVWSDDTWNNETEWSTAGLLANATVRTDAEGRYRLGTVDRRVAMLVFAARGCCTLIHRHGVRPTDDAVPFTAVTTLALPPAVLTTGRVRDAAGRPIAGARVMARDLASEWVRLADVAVTDAEGIFQLGAVPASPLELRFLAEGFAPLRTVSIDRGAPRTVSLEPARKCTGRLLDGDGKPRAGTAHLSYEDGAGESAKAGADGVFQFAIRPGLRYRLRTYESPTVNAFSDVCEGDATGIELKLGAGSRRTLAMSVTDAATQQPLAAFTAHVDWQESSVRRSNLWFSTRADSGKDGVLVLPIDPSWQLGHGLVLLRAPGRAEQIQSLPPGAREGVFHLAVAMQRERILSGRVLDKDGKPVAAARVWTVPRNMDHDRTWMLPPRCVATDADGRFRCDGLAAIEYALNVAHPGHPYVSPRAVSLAAGDVDGVALTLAPARRLELKWRNAPADADWALSINPRQGTAERGTERLPRYAGGGPLPVSVPTFARPLVVPSVATEAVDVFLRRLTVERLPRYIGVNLGAVTAGGGAVELDLAKAHPCTITGRVTTKALAAMDHLMVRTGRRRSEGAASLLQKDGSFTIEVEPGRHTLEVADLLTGLALARSKELDLASGEPVQCDLEVAVGVLDVSIGLPDGARTAMKYLSVANVGWDTMHLDLNDLRGSVRLVLPPGPATIKLMRVCGALGTSATSCVEAGSMQVTVEAGAITPVVVPEPPRLKSDELAAESGR